MNHTNSNPKSVDDEALDKCQRSGVWDQQIEKRNARQEHCIATVHSSWFKQAAMTLKASQHGFPISVRCFSIGMADRVESE
ncbi:hypothetical protein [Polaromonas sp. UBA4122]|uniref:hypothetical protein n=1 Tax=Polaromonas sp. UBA4122 TaxID=1947074 RepID=UPI0025F5D105|nr:hypothetical protein [Polaromonas sp. UBA4122]